MTISWLTSIAAWDLACSAFFAELVVLGPKCRTEYCLVPAARRVHWVTGPFLACERCAAAWRQVAETGLGMVLHMDVLHYQRGGRDDAEQRFANMELD